MNAIQLLEREQSTILDALEGLVMQEMRMDGDAYDSGFITAEARALRLLCEHGRMELVYDDGGREVRAKPKPEETE